MVKKYIITSGDVGKSEVDYVAIDCKACGHDELIYPFEPLGVVQRRDVGKICRRVGPGLTWQVENTDQFLARLKRIGKRESTFLSHNPYEQI